MKGMSWAKECYEGNKGKKSTISESINGIFAEDFGKVLVRSKRVFLLREGEFLAIYGVIFHGLGLQIVQG